MEKSEREIRSLAPIDSELKASRRGRTIEGRAIVFNSESRDMGGFKEIIEPTALDGLLEKSDVIATFNHDEDRVLARYTNGTGTLELWLDSKGLNYRFDAPDTPFGDEVLSSIRRGDVRSSSFRFRCRKPENQVWEKRSDGTHLRRIKKFEKIIDVCPVTFEAYSDTTAAVRSLIDIKTQEAEAEALKAKQEAEEAQRKLADLEAEQRAKATPPVSTDAPEDLTEYFKKLKTNLNIKA